MIDADEFESCFAYYRLIKNDLKLFKNKLLPLYEKDHVFNNIHEQWAYFRSDEINWEPL